MMMMQTPHPPPWAAPQPPARTLSQPPTKAPAQLGKSFTIEALLGKSEPPAPVVRAPPAAAAWGWQGSWIHRTAVLQPRPMYPLCCPPGGGLYSPDAQPMMPQYCFPALKSRAGKCKRIRTIFSAEQLSRLEHEFSRQQYMVGSERYLLASALGLSEAQVKVWFQNRRIKWRKQSVEQQQAKLVKMGLAPPQADLDPPAETSDESADELDDVTSQGSD